MKKTLYTLMIVFMIGLISVSAEKVEIGQGILDYLIDHYKDADFDEGFTEESILIYCNPSILNCDEFKTVVDSYSNVFMTTDYFTELSAGSLAVCFHDYSTRVNINPEEIKEYRDYCKTAEISIYEGIFSVLEEREYRYNQYIKYPESTLNEDLVYVLIGKGYPNCIHLSLDWHSPRVQAKYKVNPNFADSLLIKIKNFVRDRTLDDINQRSAEFREEEHKFLEEGNNEEYQRVYDLRMELSALRLKALEECNFDILGDYAQPFEGEVVDGFTIRKGSPPELEYSFPQVMEGLIDIGKAMASGSMSRFHASMLFARLSKGNLFIEDDQSQVASKGVQVEEPSVTKSAAMEEPSVKEQPIVEDQSIVESPVIKEEPVTGIKRITNPLKKLFAGEPEAEEVLPEEPTKEQQEQPEEEQGVISRFFSKIFSWF